MNLSAADTAQLLTALVLLLVCAHLGGALFARLRQPPVIGEILGGLLLGPTVLGHFLPGWQAAIFSSGGVTPAVLAAIYQLGLWLLMFCSGVEVRTRLEPDERKTTLLIAATGTVLPFAAGVLFFRLGDPAGWMGPAQSAPALLLVLAIAMAVTSIPVLSRILIDLGLLQTPFARIALSAAVLEDVLLYVVLAIALGLAGGAQGQLFGLPALLGLHPTGGWSHAYHVVASLGFLGAALTLGPRIYKLAIPLRDRVLRKGNAIALQLALMLALTGVALFLGVAPMFGAFVAGILAGRTSQDPSHAREAITRFSFAFFVPLYFALVGLKLDLVRHLDLRFFLLFTLCASLAKCLSVAAGALLAQETPRAAFNFAIALNARGGPGIVLASVAHDAGIINPSLYVGLVLLAITTSLVSGSWLGAQVRGGRALR